MRVVAASLSALLGGCSAYPLSSDVTTYESKHITRIMRCQARGAIVAKVANVMEEFKEQVYKGKTGPEAASYVRSYPFDLRGLKDGFSKYARDAFGYYADASVNFDFTIDSTEMNATGFDLALLKTLPYGANNFGITAKNDRTRQIKRQYRNYDSFESLLRMEKHDCENVPETINLLYPSVGFKRVDQLIDDFVEQNQHDNLGSKDKAEDAEMNDTMVFTTKFTGNFDPKISRSAIPGAVVPSQINFNLDNYRLDIHTIIILLRLPADRSKLPKFDAFGYIALTNKQIIDSKFEEIRRNNFQDDVRNLSNVGLATFR